MSLEKIEKLKNLNDIQIEVSTKIPLFGYQKVGVAFLYGVKKCFLLDDPGL